MGNIETEMNINVNMCLNSDVNCYMTGTSSKRGVLKDKEENAGHILSMADMPGKDKKYSVPDAVRYLQGIGREGIEGGEIAILGGRHLAGEEKVVLAGDLVLQLFGYLLEDLLVENASIFGERMIHGLVEEEGDEVVQVDG
jgi:hypothetical protein